jgi:hypothetical protein
MLHGSAPEGNSGLVNVAFWEEHERKTKSKQKPASDETDFMLLELLTGRFYNCGSGRHGFSKIRCAIRIPCKFLYAWISRITTSLS